jgi:signal transduction histidine kinase
LRPLQVLTTIVSIYVLITAIRAIKNNRDGAFIFSIASFISSTFVINDFLHNLKVINTGYYSTIGWFFFIFTQAYLLSKRASSAMTRVEELTENLERQVISRTRELSLERDNLINANKEIEKLSESRKRLSMIGEMASGIVHDIKNPISTIKTFTDLVKNDDITEIEKKEYLSYIAREIDRLSDLAYDILDFSKGTIQIFSELVNPAEILKEVYEFLKLDFEHSQILIKLEIHTETLIWLDKERIRRVIINLSNNAREEMSDGLRNYLFIMKLYKINDFIVFEFADNGNGLREEIKSKIFEAFYSEGKIKGTGLGLFMCKTIIDAHKGKIEYTSKEGVGTTFFIYLPINKE